MRFLLLIVTLLLLALPAGADGMPGDEPYVPIGTLVSPPPSPSPSAWYVALDGGGSWFHDLDSDAGYNVGGALGYRFDHNYRVELSTSWREASLDVSHIVEMPKGHYPRQAEGGRVTRTLVQSSEDLGVIASMVNGIFDFPLYLAGDTPVVPYIGVGMGLGVITSDSRSNEYEFAWNVLTGVGYNVWSNLHATVGYRYLQTIDPSFVSPVLAHEAVLGARWEF